MLQLREVTQTKDGWLTCNRSNTAFLQTLALAPPERAPAAALPAMWAVAVEEASVIALAEMSRWHGGVGGAPIR